MSLCQESEKSKDADAIIIEGSTWAAIWHMAWPLFIDLWIMALANFTDMWVAGHLGAEAQAATGFATQIWFFLVLLTIALSSGTSALVSRFWGAGDKENAIEAGRQSILFAVIFGSLAALVGLNVGKPLLHLLGAADKVIDSAWPLMQFDLLGQLPFTLVWIIKSIFRAKGNARLPMIVNIIIMLLIMILSVSLGLGLHMGTAGIGLAWLIGGTLGAGLLIWQLAQSELSACLRIAITGKYGVSKEWFLRIMNIGLPACIQDTIWTASNFALYLIFAKTANPTATQAAWAIGLRVEEAFATMPIYALSSAASTIIGQNLGAAQEERAEKAGWQAMLVGIVFNTTVALIMIFFARQIAALMTTDPLIAQYSASYLQINGFTEPFLAIGLVLFGAMQGAGYTRWPMWIEATSLICIRLPLAWLLTVYCGMGPIGSWIGMASSVCYVALLAVWRFRSGRWKKQVV